jgi:amino acid permease
LKLAGESNQACELKMIATFSLTGNANEPLSSEEETEQRAQQPKKAESLFWKVLNFFSRSPK